MPSVRQFHFSRDISLTSDTEDACHSIKAHEASVVFQGGPCFLQIQAFGQFVELLKASFRTGHG